MATKLNRKEKNVRVNLSLEYEFYKILENYAKNDYIQVATWTKQFLMKNLQDKKSDKTELNN